MKLCGGCKVTVSKVDTIFTV